MDISVYALFGIIAPVFYVIPTIIGGLLRPGYNHLYNSVSDLLAPGAPNKKILVPPFTVYPVLLSLFGFGVFSLLRAEPSPLNSPAGLMGFILIGAGAGILGILTMTIFPQDEQGTPMTKPGLMHLILVGIQAVSAMAAIILIGLWFNDNGYSGYFIYSILTFVALISTGIISMIGGVKKSRYMGLYERLNVLSIIQWLIVISVWLYNLT